MRIDKSGFTLIELMIATAITFIVGTVIYSAYNVQTKIYTEQDKTAEMQQNIRAGVSFLQREVRMAGYNSKDTNDASCGGSKKAGFHTATATTVGFSMDLDKDGKCDDPGENVTYSIYTADGIKKLGRKNPTQNEPIAENIAEIDFIYLLNKNGVKSQTRTPANGDLDDIVAVQVSLLAQSRFEDRKASATSSFTLAIPDWGDVPVAAKTWTFTDSNRYRLLTITINCRNRGLLL